MDYDEDREALYEMQNGIGVAVPFTRCTRNMPLETKPTTGIDMNKYQRKLTNPKGSDIVIDVYDVLNAFDVSNPATAHAIKKLLCTGTRGAKDWETDLQEAIDSLERAKSFPPMPF
jgi:hypothetical protein